MDFGGIAAGLGSLQGGILNLVATDRTNHMNQNIAVENRDWQSKENEKQRNWEYSRWLEEQSYNTPAAIMNRYRAAGINPFLGQSKISEGTTSAPAAPPMTSAPNMPHMVAPDFSFIGGSISRTLDYMLTKQQIDANSANQQAQAIKSVGEAAKYLYEAFGSERAEKMIQPLFAQVAGANMDSSIMARGAVAELRKSEAAASVASVEEKIANDLGYETAQRKLWNMDYEYQHMVAEVGLWSSIAKLNDSNIQLNSAKFDTELARQADLMADAYFKWCQSEYVKSLNLTEKEKRQWFIGNLQLDYLEHFYDVDDRQADWAFDTDVREKKRDPQYQYGQGFDFGINHGVGNAIWNKTMKMFNQSVDAGLKSRKFESVRPARAAEKRNYDYVKHRATRPTYSGKEEIEWFTPAER